MKKLTFGILLIFILASCEEETCASCISESLSGKIVDYDSQCYSDFRYVEGYVAGLKDYYKDNGDTVVVNCTYF